MGKKVSTNSKRKKKMVTSVSSAKKNNNGSMGKTNRNVKKKNINNPNAKGKNNTKNVSTNVDEKLALNSLIDDKEKEITVNNDNVENKLLGKHVDIESLDILADTQETELVSETDEKEDISQELEDTFENVFYDEGNKEIEVLEDTKEVVLEQTGDIANTKTLIKITTNSKKRLSTATKLTILLGVLFVIMFVLFMIFILFVINY